MVARVKLTPPARLALFGPPSLIEGEDADTYDELLARMLAAVKPGDVIEEMLTADVASLEWEILRWRRLKTSLLRARGLAALETFLCKNLKYPEYFEFFVDHLTEILRENLPKDQADDAQTLAQEYVRNDPDAHAKVFNILFEIKLTLHQILKDARALKAKDVVQKYARRESDAVTLVDEHLARAGMTLDTVLAGALATTLHDIERIDRLTAVAEGRRNTALREIDRRRVVLGEILRRTVQELEKRERKLLEPPAKGGKAA